MRFISIHEVPAAVRGGRGWATILRSLSPRETIEFTFLTPRTIQNCYDAINDLRKQGLQFRTVKIWDEALRVQRLDDGRA